MFDTVQYITKIIEHKCDPAEWEIIAGFKINEQRLESHNTVSSYEKVQIGEATTQKCKKCGLLNVVKWSIYDK